MTRTHSEPIYLTWHIANVTISWTDLCYFLPFHDNNGFLLVNMWGNYGK